MGRSFPHARPFVKSDYQVEPPRRVTAGGYR